MIAIIQNIETIPQLGDFVCTHGCYQRNWETYNLQFGLVTITAKITKLLILVSLELLFEVA